MQSDVLQGGDEKLQFVSPGQYAFVQDQTTGQVKVFAGPAQCNPSTQESPVFYDHRSRSFEKTSLRRATMQNALAANGEYLVLVNPPTIGDTGKSIKDLQPQNGSEGKIAAALDLGKSVNIPGPVTFPLYPQQHAQVIQGHRLRSNEYLIVRVVDEDEAKENWKNAVVKTATGEDDDGSAVPTVDFSLGQLIVIKGEDVSFYIPPTGMEVVPHSDNGKQTYVRDACTLENLEYCILIDEDGNKRYEEGPAVVFPEPTEEFWRDDKKNRKFRAIELTDLQGLHVKVVADYEGPDYESPSSGQKRQYKAGDELWLTGKKTPIYLPQPEHALITYGEGTKVHNGTTVPEGEGRYVLDKTNGRIETDKGPKILLPDPRDNVLVRRVLSDRECNLWYPGNEEALAYNRDLRGVQAEGTGNVTEEAYTRSRVRRGATPSTAYAGGDEILAASALRDAELSSYRGFESSGSAAGEQFERGKSYTKPRTLTLDQKFAGVPRICPYTGFAVQVVNANGQREVVEGPCTILLDYDQTLEVLHLSTGKVKQSDHRLATVYLRTRNNNVSDSVDVMTSDNIPIKISLKYAVDFDDTQKDRWFDVEDYVKLLTDRARSVLKGRIRKISVQEFYQNSTDIIRDICLGEAVAASSLAGDEEEANAKAGKMARPFMRFEENGMVVKDVDVLNVSIQDANIRAMLEDAQHQTIETNLKVQRAEEQLAATKQIENIDREEASERHETTAAKAELARKELELQLQNELKAIQAALEKAQQKKEATEAEEAAKDASHSAGLKRQEAEDMLTFQETQRNHDLEVAMIDKRAEAAEKTFAATKDGLADVALALSNDQTLTHIAKALSIQNALGGGDLSETINKAFQGIGADGMIKDLMGRLRTPDRDELNV